MSTFPIFSKIKSTDRIMIEHLVSHFEPYSDFNFTSMFCWNVDNSAEFALLNGNLVIKIPDYLTGEPVYSIVGDNKMDESITELLTVVDQLKLVPHSVIKGLNDSNKFEIKEDRNHFDYVYLLQDLVDTSGKKYKNVRNKISHFTNSHPDYTIEVFDSLTEKKRIEFRDIFLEWARGKHLKESDVDMESKAIEKFILYAADYKLVGIEVKVNGKSAGFSLNEILTDGDYALCHIQKATHAYKNIDTVLTHYSSKVLYDRGCRYVNWEQDLGFSGLRQLKESYQPTDYLKKYTVRLA